MFTIEDRDLFGRWQPVRGKTFDDLEAARNYCIMMSDATGIAHRIMHDGEPIDTVDLEAGFWALGRPDQGDQPD